MNGSNAARISMIVMLAFIGALLLGALMFLTGMQSSSYIVSDGIDYTLRFMDKPRYDRNLMGLIYTGVFITAGLLLLLMLTMPDERALAALRQAASMAPQPRRRRPAPGGAPAPAAASEPAAAAPSTQPPPAPPPEPAVPAEPEPPAETAAPARSAEALAGTVTALEGEQQAAAAAEAAATPAPPPAPAKPAAPEVPVDLAAQQDAMPDPADLPSSGMELSGEEDVVYGNGPVTEESVLEFIQNYPDSAVKFLYRKNLDNRSLPPVEEDIYQRWERRGMSRAKVRQFVLEFMDWERLPDDFPHVIWLRLRDRIYDLRTQVHA